MDVLDKSSPDIPSICFVVEAWHAGQCSFTEDQVSLPIGTVNHKRAPQAHNQSTLLMIIRRIKIWGTVEPGVPASQAVLQTTSP